MRRAVVYRATTGSLLATAALCLAAAASAKPTPKESADATAAFKACREKEKSGSAADCWRAWLEKHRKNGSEAEVIVAEEHAEKDEGAAKPDKSDEAEEEEEAEEKEPSEEEQPAEGAASVSVSASTEAAAAPPGAFKLGVGTVEGSPVYSMAPAEGIGVGSSLIVRDENGRRAALFKVKRRGAGEQPNELALRLGAAEQGAALEPYKMLGMSAMLHPSVGVLLPGLSTGSTWYPRTPNAGHLQFKLPQAYLGCGVSVGYDVSGLISWSESNVRLRGEYLAGLYGVGTRVRAWAFELAFEKGFYLAKALELYAGLGPTATIASVDVLPPDLQVSGQPNSVQTLRAFRFGGAAYVGAEALLHPHIGIRLEGFVHANIPAKGYVSADGGPVYWDFAYRKDSFSMGGGRLGVIGMF